MRSVKAARILREDSSFNLYICYVIAHWQTATLHLFIALPRSLPDTVVFTSAESAGGGGS